MPKIFIEHQIWFELWSDLPKRNHLLVDRVKLVACFIARFSAFSFSTISRLINRIDRKVARDLFIPFSIVVPLIFAPCAATLLSRFYLAPASAFFHYWKAISDRYRCSIQIYRTDQWA